MRINQNNILRLPSGRALLQNTPFELGADGDDAGIGEGIKTATKASSQLGVKKDSKAGKALAGAGAGAAAGATIGSVVPGIGTAIGAGVGAVTGVIASLATGIGGKEHRKRRARKAIAADLLRLAKFKKPLNETWYKGNLIYVLGVPGTQKEHEMTFHRYINGEDTVISKADAINFIGLTNKGRSWMDHNDKIIIASNHYGEQFLEQLKPKEKAKSKPKTKSNTTKSTGLAVNFKSITDKIKKPPKITIKVDKLANLVEDLKTNIKKDAKKLATSTEINEDLVNKLAISNSKINKANSLLAAVGLPKSFYVS